MIYDPCVLPPQLLSHESDDGRHSTPVDDVVSTISGHLKNHVAQYLSLDSARVVPSLSARLSLALVGLSFGRASWARAMARHPSRVAEWPIALLSRLAEPAAEWRLRSVSERAAVRHRHRSAGWLGRHRSCRRELATRLTVL